MRRDIQIDTHINDLVLKNKKAMGTYSFEWVSESDLYLMGQIIIPKTVDVRILQTDGLKIEIPYTPVYKPFKIKVLRYYDEDNQVAVVNPVNGSEWFDVYTNLWSQQKKRLCASQLVMLNTDTYIIQLNYDDGIGYVWSSSLLDAVNIPANIQNRNLMLQCIPSNNYRYPVSGVGLVRYLHANLSQTDLANVLQSEFKADKVRVKSASFNAYTGDIDLDLDFSEADESI